MTLEAAARGLLAPLRADEGRIDNRIAEANLVAIERSNLPEGNTHWTLKLLEDKAEESGCMESIARETVRRAWKKRSRAKKEQGVAHP